MNKYNYATHNSMTYLKPYWWIMRLVAWMARCQNKSISYQLNNGVRLFDLRVKATKRGKYVFQHGFCRYSHERGKGDVLNVLSKINQFACWCGEDVYVRLTCEILKDNSYQKACFENLCRQVEEGYTHIKFFGGNAKYNWSEGIKIYEFKAGYDRVNERITERFRSRYHATLFPWVWAKANNCLYKQGTTTKEYLMLDFFQLPYIGE